MQFILCQDAKTLHQSTVIITPIDLSHILIQSSYEPYQEEVLAHRVSGRLITTDFQMLTVTKFSETWEPLLSMPICKGEKVVSAMESHMPFLPLRMVSHLLCLPFISVMPSLLYLKHTKDFLQYGIQSTTRLTLWNTLSCDFFGQVAKFSNLPDTIRLFEGTTVLMC